MRNPRRYHCIMFDMYADFILYEVILCIGYSFNKNDVGTLANAGRTYTLLCVYHSGYWTSSYNMAECPS